jgi:hypothetical protein
VQSIQDALQGDFGGIVSQTNPLIGATADYINKKDSFYGRNYGPTDYSKMSGPLGGVVSLLARGVPGGTNEAGQVSDNLFNYITSLVPPVNQVARLAPSSTGANKAGWDTFGKWARYGGAPIQILTPAAQKSAMTTQQIALRNELRRRQAMAREAAS